MEAILLRATDWRAVCPLPDGAPTAQVSEGHAVYLKGLVRGVQCSRLLVNRVRPERLALPTKLACHCLFTSPPDHRHQPAV